MKPLIIVSIGIVFCLTSLRLHAQSTEPIVTSIKWMSFEDAMKLNSGYPKKKVFIDLYTSWCGWCKKMDAETFIDPQIVNYMNDNFLAVKFDAERKDTVEYNGQKLVNQNPTGARSAHQLAIALLQGRMSYPSYVILDENSQKVTAIPGFLKAPEFLPILMYFATNQHFSMPWEAYLKQYKSASTPKE
jgi:thioredoxin-related protein